MWPATQLSKRSDYIAFSWNTAFNLPLDHSLKAGMDKVRLPWLKQTFMDQKQQEKMCHKQQVAALEI